MPQNPQCAGMPESRAMLVFNCTAQRFEYFKTGVPPYTLHPPMTSYRVRLLLLDTWVLPL